MGTDIFIIVNNRPQLDGYIKSIDEINKDVVEKIRKEFSYDEEEKLKRLAINALVNNDPIPAEYTNFNNYVEDCRQWGDEQKALADNQLAELKEIEIPDGEATRKIWVRS